jgi:dTMP kinase
MDLGLSQDINQSFHIFQSRILTEYDKIVQEFGLTVMDATKDIATQQAYMRELTSKALAQYKPRRGTHGRRTQFWRRFDVSKSE